MSPSVFLLLVGTRAGEALPHLEAGSWREDGAVPGGRGGAAEGATEVPAGGHDKPGSPKPGAGETCQEGNSDSHVPTLAHLD